MKTPYYVFLFFIILLLSEVRADFFNITRIDFMDKVPKDEIAVYNEIKDHNNKIKERIFLPALEVTIFTQEQTLTKGLIAKAYFYDRNKNLITTVERPTPYDHKAPKDPGGRKVFDMPVFLPKITSQKIFFAIPESVLKQEWQTVVVFGDEKEVTVQVYRSPDSSSYFAYNFPEKTIFENKNKVHVERKPALDPVVEYVVKTKNPKQPQITLFLRFPIGITNASQANGVLAMCVIASSLSDIRRQLQSMETEDDVGGVLRFAQERKLIVICWSARSFWNIAKNWSELDKEEIKEEDIAFGKVADAWADGVDALAQKYGFPNNNYLLWGYSASAMHAARLAIRKPEYFLAAHIHIAASFDKPTLEANKILWCVTTGELDYGYVNSQNFFKEAKKLGYPIIFKAVEHLGHSGHPVITALGLNFFDYALSLRDQRIAYDASLKEKSSYQTEENESPRPWVEAFRNPPFIGDMVNQGMVTADKQNDVPEGFRVPLPTQTIADTWNTKTN